MTRQRCAGTRARSTRTRVPNADATLQTQSTIAGLAAKCKMPKAVAYKKVSFTPFAKIRAPPRVLMARVLSRGNLWPHQRRMKCQPLNGAHGPRNPYRAVHRSLHLKSQNDEMLYLGKCLGGRGKKRQESPGEVGSPFAVRL